MHNPLPNKLMPFIWHFLKPYKYIAVLFILISMITGFWGPINSYLIKYIIDILNKTPPDEAISVVFWPAILFVINFEIHNLCWRATSYINCKLQPVINNKVVSKTFEYIHKASHQFFQDNLAGRIASQVSILVDNMERIVHDISKHIARGVVLLIVAFIAMFSVHPEFFYILLVWFVTFSFFSISYSKRLISLSEAHATSESTLAGQLVDSITNASTVRIFARRSYEIAYLEKALLTVKKAFQSKEIFAIRLNFFQGFSLTIMLGLMIYFLVQLWMAKKISIGDFALILGLSVEVGYMTWWALEQVDELNKAVGRCKQSLDSLFKPLEIKDKANAKELIATSGQIVFDKVRFHYKDNEPLFQNKSVTIEAGQKVGLVGYSGSGKSTFANLILRLHDVTDGKILIDGQDIREVTQDSLRANIAMIPQDPSLFHRSLMDNIRYGRIEASDKDVILASRLAHVHDFVTKLPNGYDSLVGERGIKLSGGQRQRVAIARAILKNAPILILDEATSQLDSVTEELIQESLWSLMQGRTSIVIAHRLSTLLHMDRILVFDKGKIVEDGKHKELLSKDGLYKTLWNAQVGGFLPDRKMETA
jgi:ATP-binding cassette subfamily B protein